MSEETQRFRAALERIEATRGTVVDQATLWDIARDALAPQCTCGTYLSADHDCEVHPRPGGFLDQKRRGAR